MIFLFLNETREASFHSFRKEELQSKKVVSNIGEQVL
jgi:hypothetical protein